MKVKESNNPSQPNIASLHSLLSSEQLQELLLTRSKTAVMELGVQLLEQDVEALCGSSFQRKGEALCHRGGSDRTSIVMDGMKVRIRRPRVRSSDGEVQLPTLAKLKDIDLFDDRIRERLIQGISTRNYESLISDISGKTSVSKSNVSRAFIRASQKDLDELNTSDLSEESFVAIMIDGVEFSKRTVIVALGISHDLKKVPLGIREGSTENSELVKDLLAGIMDRGFTLHCQKILAVIDGSKALRKGLLDLFGDRVIIQRCWLHKLCNLKGYLPESSHNQLYWRMKKLMNLTKWEDAIEELKSFESWLSEHSLEAERAIQEVGYELIAVTKLKLPKRLRESLSTTNPVESLIGVTRDKTNKVKNWKSSKNQITRWVASAIQQHKPKMRRLWGFKHAGELVHALGKLEKNERMA